MWKVAAIFLVTGWLEAQDSLSLKEAVQLALRRHPASEAARSGVRAAEARIQAARGGYLPKLNYAESWQRTNNPVYVFSALLTQAQFTERNFAIPTLNRPDFLNNFQSQLSLDQAVYDGGRTRLAVRSAELNRNLAGEEQRRTDQEIIAGVVRAYFGVLLADQALQVAREAVRSAEADLDRARAIRAAGMSTDADVLSIQVHLAAMREQQIRREAELDVAHAALNEALGLPLGTRHKLSTPLTAAAIPEAPLEQYEKSAVDQRPEARQAVLAVNLAQTGKDTARAALRPQLAFRTVFEADRQRFVTRGAANWLVALSLRWNLFDGFQDRLRIRESEHALRQAQAQQRRAESLVRLHVHKAYADWKAARERIQVAQAAVAMAEESLRITRNRYEAGLANVTDLLRNETALLEARTRYLAALYDQRMAAVGLAHAAGILTADSEVLQ